MTIRVDNLFANLPELYESEQSLSLFEKPSIRSSASFPSLIAARPVFGTIRMRTSGSSCCAEKRPWNSKKDSSCTCKRATM